MSDAADAAREAAIEGIATGVPAEVSARPTFREEEARTDDETALNLAAVSEAEIEERKAAEDTIAAVEAAAEETVERPSAWGGEVAKEAVAGKVVEGEDEPA